MPGILLMGTLCNYTITQQPSTAQQGTSEDIFQLTIFVQTYRVVLVKSYWVGSHVVKLVLQRSCGVKHTFSWIRTRYKAQNIFWAEAYAEVREINLRVSLVTLLSAVAFFLINIGLFNNWYIVTRYLLYFYPCDYSSPNNIKMFKNRNNCILTKFY